MAISTMDALIASFCATTAQKHGFHKLPTITAKLGYWHSQWKEPGRPFAGTTPTVFGSGGDIPTSATTGAIIFTDPAGGNALYLVHFTVEFPTQGTGSTSGVQALLVDRLWECSGMSGTVLTAQTVVSPPALTRPDSTGAGAEIWVETYATPGATARTATIVYTDAVNGGSRTATCNFPASANSGDCQPATLQAGDHSPSSVQSLTWSASTGSAGNYGITIVRRIADIPAAIGLAAGSADDFFLSMPTIDASACLALYLLYESTGPATLVTGSLRLCEG